MTYNVREMVSRNARIVKRGMMAGSVEMQFTAEQYTALKNALKEADAFKLQRNELLEALSNLRATIGAYGIRPLESRLLRAYDIASAAIAKARGK